MIFRSLEFLADPIIESVFSKGSINQVPFPFIRWNIWQKKHAIDFLYNAVMDQKVL